MIELRPMTPEEMKQADANLKEEYRLYEIQQQRAADCVSKNNGHLWMADIEDHWLTVYCPGCNSLPGISDWRKDDAPFVGTIRGVDFDDERSISLPDTEESIPVKVTFVDESGYNSYTGEYDGTCYWLVEERND